MGRVIVVTPEELEKTASLIESLASDYKSQYDALYNETGALAAKWKGKDNVAFINQIDGFKDDLKSMYQLMNNYVDFLRKTAKAYRATQDEVVAQAKRLSN